MNNKPLKSTVKNTPISISLAFLFVGFLCVFWFVGFNAQNYNFQQNAERVTGRVNDIAFVTKSSYYIVSVTYEINGDLYKSAFQQQSRAGMNIGDNITLYYNKDYPMEVQTEYKLSGASAAVGGLFIVCVGCYMLYQHINSKRKSAWLLQSGKPLQARIVAIERSLNNKRNNVSKYYVVAEAENTRYVSDKTPRDLNAFSGGTATIYVNPDIPNEYYIPLNEIKEALT